ncbi:hypothetical protein CC1G_06481 [Coprinopsis cinerea okayama7|uniref:Uncharacterized protein n=1 Tax=Coprinopsis cinerea (strain Okayama-7 / 130 / ATCC MYA-4618 / FGSC 9003) TaxID=240176 RepID=A8NN97_COPC7|nr:hypothetical protein CC1G_06481 [Coprinopsis cinerea okayama7\|eukprot:XP_001835078.2 hypothetical protein CC1G_06481 [Coprinopsis cinerea okayama7\
MAHQMQAYANYIASLNQQAHASSSHILPPNPVLPGVPPSVPAPATPSIPPPESNAQVEPTPMISADDNDTAEPPDATVAQKADPAGEGDVGTNSQIEVLTDSSTSVPGDAGSQTKPGSATDLKQTDNAVAEKEQSNVAATASTPSQPQTSLVPPAHSSPAIGTLPFGPHPVHSPLSPTFPTIPLGSFPHHHPPYFQHPSSPHPQSPGMGVIPFGFPHMPHLNHQHPPHLQQPHQHTPPYPVMTLGLNGMGPGAHVPSLQSPAPPGMMHHQHQQPPHYGSGSAPGSSTAAGFPPLTPNAHPSVGSNMGIGMMSGMNTNPSVPSPLWMSGVLPNGSAAAGNSGSVAGSSGKYATSSSPDLDLLSDPSSPSPAFFQERGRRGKNGRSGSSLSGGGSSGEKDDEGEGSKENDGDESRVGRGEDDSDDGSDFNALLADAILKRPSSIRMGSGSKTSSSNYGKDSSSSSKLGGLAGSVSLDGVWPATLSGMGQQDLGRAGREHAEEDPVAEEVESEFTFPSLSELGNVAREKRVGTPAPADAVASPKPLSTGVESLILKNEMDNPSSASIHGPGQ